MCIDGNVMEIMFSFGTPDEVDAHCKKLIEHVGKGGGFILKGEIPKEAKHENVRSMIDAVHKYG